MTKIENTLRNTGRVGQNLTQSNTAETGTPPTYLIIGNSAINAGTSEMQYTDDLSSKGVPVCARLGVAAANTYLRYDRTEEPGNRRFVIRRPYYSTGDHSSVNVNYLAAIRLSGIMSASLSTYQGRMQVYRHTVPYEASRSVVLTPGEIYWVELMIQLESATGAGDGAVGYRLTDNSNGLINEFVEGGLSTTTTPPAQYRFLSRGDAGSPPDSWSYLWDIQGGPLASGWWGPIGSSVPLATPVLTLVSDTPASSADADDREIEVSWPAVPNASGYRALSAPSGSVDYSTVTESVTSPYTFLNRTAGGQRVAIQAKGD